MLNEESRNAKNEWKGKEEKLVHQILFENIQSNFIVNYLLWRSLKNNEMINDQLMVFAQIQ